MAMAVPLMDKIVSEALLLTFQPRIQLESCTIWKIKETIISYYGYS